MKILILKKKFAMAYYVTFHTNIEYLSTIPKCGRMTLLYEIVVWNEMSHYPKLPSPAIIKQLQNFPLADQSRRFILSVGYLFRVRESVGWPVNNFLLCCLHKKWSWSKRAEDVSICLTLISEECYKVAIVSTAHSPQLSSREPLLPMHCWKVSHNALLKSRPPFYILCRTSCC